ncbi:unnamed protein product [Danaus chrysippus]|uniref:(African queen) hypothetical protein n=1 Tax=Danaus chrysippus TaxID=151541 RepID=A0A8J2MWJ0_9NEOP|nr:unnamed protein product [Danaus chrysippus]
MIVFGSQDSQLKYSYCLARCPCCLQRRCHNRHRLAAAEPYELVNNPRNSSEFRTDTNIVIFSSASATLRIFQCASDIPRKTS